jgi:hypothetical protein
MLNRSSRFWNRRLRLSAQVRIRPSIAADADYALAAQRKQLLPRWWP